MGLEWKKGLVSWSDGRQGILVVMTLHEEVYSLEWHNGLWSFQSHTIQTECLSLNPDFHTLAKLANAWGLNFHIYKIWTVLSTTDIDAIGF